jgi:hypothetical protein
MKLKKYLTTPTEGKDAVILKSIKDNDAKANETLTALNKQGNETMEAFQKIHVEHWNELKQNLLERGLITLEEKLHGDFSYNEFGQIFLDRLHIPQTGSQQGAGSEVGETTGNVGVNAGYEADAPTKLRPVPTPAEEVTAKH